MPISIRAEASGAKMGASSRATCTRPSSLPQGTSGGREQMAVLRSGGTRLDEPAQKRGQAASAEVVKARP